MTTETTEMRGKITPEGLQAMRNRIGVLPGRGGTGMGFTSEAHPDTIRRFAWSYGDDNPLFADPKYGPKTRWGGTIAPPGYSPGGLPGRGAEKIPDHVRAAGRGALTGVPNYHSGSEHEWLRPIYPGDQTAGISFIEDVVEKRSEFGGGNAVIVYHRSESYNQRNELVHVGRSWFFHVEREASESAGKYMKVTPKVWTQEELDEVDAVSEKEFRRGADTLFFEDVQVGMDMPTMVKGPLCNTDIICWHIGHGIQGFGVAPLRLGYLNRKRIPAFYTKNDYGFWDAAMRVHWEDERAKRVGNPRAYDYGAMRTAWINHYCTNWMGDDAWLWKETDQARKFNYHGDIQWVRGKVVSKRIEEDRNVVELEVWCENQRGEITSPGGASILVPSRERGPVVIPVREVEPTPLRNEFSADVPASVW